jgi:death-on-curing protein
MLTVELVLELHRLSLEQFGGMEGIRDVGLLESAVNAPFSGIGDMDFYPDGIDKAAVLVRGLVQNHPFFDGNKRTGYFALRYFLETNGYTITATEDEKYDFVVAIASSQMGVSDIDAWLKQHTARKA